MYSTDKKHIIINEIEASVVKRMFTLAQSGYSLKHIAETFNSEYIYTRRNNAWSKASVWTILKNDFYIGVLTYRGHKIVGNHTALISKIQFGKVQAQLNRRNKQQST